MSSQRRRCGECRHSPRAHTETGCQLCACPEWLDNKKHTWRETVTDAWFMATHAWILEREAVAIGYGTEEAEFEENHPRPRLNDFMHAMSPGRPPEELEALMSFQVCRSCHGTGHAQPANDHQAAS